MIMLNFFKKLVFGLDNSYNRKKVAEIEAELSLLKSELSRLKDEVKQLKVQSSIVEASLIEILNFFKLLSSSKPYTAEHKGVNRDAVTTSTKKETKKPNLSVIKKDH